MAGGAGEGTASPRPLLHDGQNNFPNWTVDDATAHAEEEANPQEDGEAQEGSGIPSSWLLELLAAFPEDHNEAGPSALPKAAGLGSVDPDGAAEKLWVRSYGLWGGWQEGH